MSDVVEHISKSCELQVSSVTAQVCTVTILILQLALDALTDLCSQLQLKTKFANAPPSESTPLSSVSRSTAFYLTQTIRATT